MNGTVVAILIAVEAGGKLQTLETATLESGKGIVGDRYYKRSGTFSKALDDSTDREVTLIENEEIERYNARHAAPLPPGSFRRNIVTRGIGLNALVGRQFTVGDAVLEGTRLCEPCAYLAGLIGPDVVKGMLHRAGLRARVIEGSIVRPGDTIHVRDAGLV
jgi:MOSC domain-containing protein YiiM